MFAHLQSLLACAWQDLVTDPNDTGFRLFVRDGVVGMDFSPQGPNADVEAAFLHPSSPALLCDVQPLRLSRTDAKSLQRELHTLLESYRDRVGDDDYVVFAGLATGRFSFGKR